MFIDEQVLHNCGVNTICASFCKLFRPINRLHALLLYWEIQDMQSSGRMIPYKKHGANGINNFDFEGFLEHKLLIPNKPEFINPFNSFMQKMSNIQYQFTILKEARDRLLPQLMSGELKL